MLHLRCVSKPQLARQAACAQAGAGYRGYWEDNQTFVVEVEEIANRDAFAVRQRFMDDLVMVEAKERTHEAVMTFEGRLQN